MTTTSFEHPATITPTAEESRLARDSGRQIAKLLGQHTHNVTVRVAADDANETIEIPLSAFKLLSVVLNEMAQGNAVTIIPVHAELTTQQAADLLNVSRPFVIDLIENKTLPCRMVGSHRRILFRDLMEYRRKIDQDRLDVLAQLARQAQELNMGY